MPAYVIGRVTVTDPEQYGEYTAESPGSIAEFGGRFIARGGELTTFEGPEETRRIVVLEFDSAEQAKAWYHSERYTRVRKLREGAADFEMVLVEGVA